ncbi:hypothetical protein ILUMI_17910 [Ignelater luminosus]|uniref:Uncharacterized protein n=1 Tax=Ignelater luminosus TaxID=2038154 RepID=A0A8K0CJ13_IGNLU|nr:hypothetical protein ILUMI_17910 [Ignelater luminosus]
MAYAVVALFYITNPFLLGNRTLPFECYLFSVNITKSPTYEILYVYQAIGTTIGCIVSMGFDILFVCFIWRIVWELKFIKEGFSNVYVNLFTLEDDEDSIKELKVLIRHHDDVLSTPYHFSLTFMYTVYLVVFTGHVGLYCFAGSYIVSESESVAYAIYETNWWTKTQPNLRRGMVLSILRSQHCAKLTAGSMFSLDLKSFTGILKTSLSFFTVIRSVYFNRNTQTE